MRWQDDEGDEDLGYDEPGAEIDEDDEAAVARAALERRPQSPRQREVAAQMRLERVLHGARSVVVTRLPMDERDLERLGEIGRLTSAITRAELIDVVASGGIKPWIEEHLGSGRFLIEWVGGKGQILHARELELPDVTAAALKLRTERQLAEAERLEATRQEAEARRRAEAEAQARAAHTEWARAHAATAVVEAGRRSRNFDRTKLFEETARFLGRNASHFYPRHLYDGVVTTALEPYLPLPPPGRYVPWEPLLCPVPLQDLWARDMAQAALPEAYRRDPRADLRRVYGAIIDALRKAAPVLYPRGVGDPVVWPVIEAVLPRPPRLPYSRPRPASRAR